jgi:iron complex outermembrane recepter protein
MFFVIFGVVFYCSSVAQHSLQGTLSGALALVDGATVRLAGPTRQTTITQNGRFAFANLPSGQYSIAISFAGFASFDSMVTVPGPELTIALAEGAPALQHVEVKAVRAGEAAPFTKTNLGKATIEQANLGTDIPMVLNQVPGVVVNSDAGNGVGYTALRVRGSDGSRINVTLNGVPYNDAESQGSFFVNMPDLLSSVHSIQVQRGVGTSSNGPGAFGAGISLSTGEYNSEAYGALHLGFGAFGTFKQTLKYGSGLLGNRFTIDARLSRIASRGFIDRASSQLLGAYLNLAWWGKTSSLRLVVLPGKEKTYQAWYGVPQALLATHRRANSAGTEKPGEPYPNETDNYSQNHYQLIYTKNWTKGLVLNTTAYLSTGKGYFEQYNAAQALAAYGLPPLNGSTETDLVRQLWLRNHLVGQTFWLQQKFDRASLTLGGNVNTYAGRHFGDVVWSAAKPNLYHRWYHLNARKSDVSSYLKYEQPLGSHWQLFADLQYRFVPYRINGFRNNPTLRQHHRFHFVNPKFGLSFKKAHWQGFASYAMGNKEPNRDDFEAVAAQQPSPERLHNVELNLQHRQPAPGWQAGLTLYGMFYHNQLLLTGKVNDVGAYTRTNVRKSYRLGAELETRYQHNGLSLTYNLALSHNRVANFVEYLDDYDNGGQVSIAHGAQPISFSPSVVQYMALGYAPAKRLLLELLGKHVGRQFLDNTGNLSRSLNPFFVTDLRLSYQIMPKKMLRSLQLILLTNNVFNHLYEPNGYTFSYLANGRMTTENFYYPMAGRHIMAAVNLSF